MNRFDETRPESLSPDATASSELDGFGLNLPDESWLGRVREAERDRVLGSIGAYKLIAEISRGAQGIVYRARQPNTNRDIALKRLVAGRFSTASARERFTREIKVAAALSHPNIVSVYGAELIDDQPVLAMEWVDGTTIDAWAFPKDATPPTLDAKLRAFLNVCAAVQHAHQRGVIHRDLKPSNVLVDRKGKPLVVDFGLAKSLSPLDGDDSSELALTQDFVGTPLYAAPEQVRSDHQAIDVRTDVYSLGVIFYELLTGTTPHHGAFHQLIEAIQKSDPAPPSKLQQGMSRELDAIALKALRKDPAERYQSIDAMATDVRAHLDGGVVCAHPPTTAYRCFKAVKRHALAFAFGVTVFALLIAFASVSWLQAQRLEMQRSAAEKRFTEVRGLSRTLIYGIHDEIATLKGALPARQLIVATGLKYLDALAEESDDNVELLLECADGYFRIAALQGNPNGANLGQTEPAQESCRKGMAIVNALREAYPDNGNILRHAALGQHMLANILTALGQTSVADATYDEALELRAKSAELDPKCAEKPPEREQILADFAACLERADRFGEAETKLVEVIELLRVRLQESQSPSAIWDLKLGNALASLGHMRVQQGLVTEAAEPLEEAIDVLESAVDAYPDHENIWRSLVVARSDRARVAAAQGDVASAQSELEVVIEAHHQMIESDPDNVTAYHDLAAAHHFLGRILDEGGDVEGSLKQFEEMLRIRKRLAKVDPSSMIAKRGVAIGMDTTGTALRKLGNVDGALSRHLAAKTTFEEILTQDPDNPRHQRSVAISAYYLGQLYQDLAQGENVKMDSQVLHWTNARDQFVHAKTLMKDLQGADLLLADESDIIEMLSDNILHCDQQLEDVED